MTDFPSDKEILENNIPVCEYCRCRLSAEEVEDGTVCEICKPLDRSIRIADLLDDSRREK